MGNAFRKGAQLYMAPEVYFANKADATADLYALGIVMYRMPNGQRMPFMPLTERFSTLQERDAAMVARYKGAPVLPPLQGGKRLAKAICKACTYQPAKRFHSSEAMRDALSKCLRERGNDEQLIFGGITAGRSGRGATGIKR